MKHAVALSFSKNEGQFTSQKIELCEVDADSQLEALGKAISDVWSGGWHLTHFKVKILKAE